MDTMSLITDYKIEKSGRRGPTAGSGLQIVVYSNLADSAAVEKDIPIPYGMIERYAGAAVKQAIFEELQDGDIYASIPDFEGVWSSSPSYAEVIEELTEVVKEWVTLKLIDGDDDIPVVGDIDLRVFN